MNEKRTIAWSSLALLICSCLAACGPGASGPRTYSVSGQVSFDQKPVSKGQIIFRPSDEQLHPVASNIEDGEYELRLPAGEYLVVVTASREVPGKFDTSNPGEKTPIIEQYIPEEFNARSTLHVMIAQENSQTHNFDLKEPATAKDHQ